MKKSKIKAKLNDPSNRNLVNKTTSKRVAREVMTDTEAQEFSRSNPNQQVNFLRAMAEKAGIPITKE